MKNPGNFEPGLRRFSRLVLLSLVLGLAGCGDALVSHFAFVPGVAGDADRLPDDPRLAEHYFDSLDGTRLHAITMDHPNPRRYILYLHGNAGHAYHRIYDIRQLSETAQARVLLVDYRGYGRSEGHAHEEGVYQDAQAALDWMKSHWGTDSREVVVVGRSLGTAVGIDLAAKRPVAALVLVSPLESGLAMADAMGLGWFSGLVDEPFDSLAKVRGLHIPALFIHGDRDRVVPLKQGEALFQAYAGSKKRFVKVEGAGHNDIVPFMGQRYYRLIGDFVQRVSVN